ncbi:carbohydrate ABC transporter permease [Candidatus Galacturonibacter soehngenii]|uniref:Carbohydrate ABC transporter permease n=1 Tax=Candidatus Galacturonatibacter soehngenii TaxID=2307010 RepID=A0A7V7UAR5_9FIRM|nr:carbohydrate ABC transporter permease [Candidatus Galacturonibacter soehngenii]KAB1435723.1 carbohydrate ABC transporter permease [Candidatus Galacturonibacter soehngenii]
MFKMKKHIRLSKEDMIFNILSYSIITVLIFICLYPLWYVACASISEPTIVAASHGILLWPKQITMFAYQKVFANKEIWYSYANTIFYTFAGTALNIILTSMLAYALSHKNIMLKKPLTLFVMFTMFFNGGMIPTYLVIRNLGLLNTRIAVLLPGLVSVFNFIIMRTHFESLPGELEESAKIDGANYWTTFTKIILPVSKATIAVMVLYYGVSHWNSWFNEMLYLPNTREYWPLALITREIIMASSSAAMSDGSAITQEVADAIKYATIVISTLPIICLYPFLQKYFAKGVMMGSVKG